MKETRKEEQAAPTAPAPVGESSAPTPKSDTKKTAGLDYVFKITKADPKNSFDFEDVADK